MKYLRVCKSGGVLADFMILDEVLRSKFWYTAVPKLPSKKYFFNFDDEFIKKRKKELETYLKEVLQVQVATLNPKP